ncbi:hypothetical protein [Streptomyces sp. NPDC055189]
MVMAASPANRTAQRHAHRVLAAGAIAVIRTVVVTVGTLTIPLCALWDRISSSALPSPARRSEHCSDTA